ncbi:MAG: UvrD-helicase domain-containing protein [Bdellovibrionales bacterium]|nr:UvrD-helicase domain-containing protein [Bdellovibrionales bacterium]
MKTRHQFLSNLNPEQQEAVKHFEGPILVLAGAGSGKTRVLTYRIAYLVNEYRVDPRSILAVTFTNKATEEMRSRLTGLLGADSQRLWVATFHSAGLRILRQHAHLLGYSNGFAVYDSQDTKAVVKAIMKEKGLDEKRNPAAYFTKLIDEAKNNCLTPEEFRKALSGTDDLAASVYEDYQKHLLNSDAMDFGDLLSNTVHLFNRYPEILARYQNALRFILVDEYQDTNHVQYLFISMITAKFKNLLVVGDDDQSIYAFRGATICNILDFEKDYPNAKVVKLEQNYRSTANILAAAQSVIEKNEQRKNKKLWTQAGQGSRITTYLAQDELDEADFIVKEIESLKNAGRDLAEIAVFYRTNAQSRAIEEALLNSNIPYRIYGGLKFYERKEVKDILGYLRLLANPADNQAFLRVVNNPPRGIGTQTVRSLALAAQKNNSPLYQAMQAIPNPSKGVSAFIKTISELAAMVDRVSLDELVRQIIEKSGYGAALKASKDPNAVSRLENLEELVAIAHLRGAGEGGARSQLVEFLDRVALTAGSDDPEGANIAEEDKKKNTFVTLMTLHLAKGLEFPVVFLSGLEEGLLPHHRSLHDRVAIEEERRLCYVGITRAMQHLYISRAFTRGMFASGGFGVSGVFRDASRFAYDIPSELLEHRGHEFLMSSEPEVKFYDEDEFEELLDELGSESTFSQAKKYTRKKNDPKKKSIGDLISSADDLE